MSDTHPITPDEVTALQVQVRPTVVFEAFNRLIARNWDGRSSTVYQDEVTKLILELAPELSREQIIQEHMLDVEPSYRAVGWKVYYDKPGWNETGRAHFVFTRA